MYILDETRAIEACSLAILVPPPDICVKGYLGPPIFVAHARFPRMVCSAPKNPQGQVTWGGPAARWAMAKREGGCEGEGVRGAAVDG